MRVLALLVAALLVAAPLARAEPREHAAYRVGTAANRVALLPVRCGRDMETALCSTIDDALAVDLARDPRLDVLSPRDLEVLLGAQQLVELSTCEGEGCFDPSAFTQIQASYLVVIHIGRLGNDAMITARLVDLKRGIVLDRDEARAWRGSESAIDQATRAVTRGILVRRGIASPPSATEDASGNPALFWSGIVGVGLGAVGLGVGGAVGGLGYLEAHTLRTTPGLTQPVYDAGAARARTYASVGDVGLIAGGALAVVGTTLIVIGSL